MHLPPIFQNLSDKERECFVALALEHEKELSLHETPGRLWEKDEQGKDWSHVTEHCLMEALRVDMFARLLGLPEIIRGELVSAAILHDFYKKEDILRTKEDIAAGGSGRNGALAAEEEDKKILRSEGFSENVISLVGIVAGDPQNVFRLKDILDSIDISSQDIAHFVMHYVDNYTRGSSWAEAAEHNKRGDFNDVDRRNEMNESNPAYRKMNREGLELNERHPFFRGMTRFEAAAAVNHLIEQKLADIMRMHGANISDPLDMPELVDARIKGNILKK